jgi:hypothetical protein
MVMSLKTKAEKITVFSVLLISLDNFVLKTCDFAVKLGVFGYRRGVFGGFRACFAKTVMCS